MALRPPSPVILSRSGRLAWAVWSLLSLAGLPARAGELTVDDFNAGLIGWAYNRSPDANATPALTTNPARSGQALRLRASLPRPGSWASAEKTLAQAQDWTFHTGLRLWVLGQGPAARRSFAVQVVESRGERWEKRVAVGWSGWRQVTVPFAELTPAGAVSDRVLDRSMVTRLAIAQSGPQNGSDLVFDDITAYDGGATGSGSIVPLYSYPAEGSANGPVLSENWQRLVQVKARNPALSLWAIVNTDSGPGVAGTADAANYAFGIRSLRAAGIRTLGYTYTRYAGLSEDFSRTLAVVKQQIDGWVNIYGTDAPDGIFFDEMANQDGPSPEPGMTRVQYYAELSRYAKSRGAQRTVGNPGIDTTRAFAETVDTLVIYESAGFPPASAYNGWHAEFPRVKWSILAHTVPTPPAAARIADARRFVGFLFTTDDFCDEAPDPNCLNPWDELPKLNYLDLVYRRFR